jgi:quercetin dioxygenase-like cupin family protein
MRKSLYDFLRDSVRHRRTGDNLSGNSSETNWKPDNVCWIQIESNRLQPESAMKMTQIDGLILPASTNAGVTEPEPGLRREILSHTPAMMLVRHAMDQGWRGAAHAHSHEQLVYVISGCIRVSVNGQSIDVYSGGNFIVGSNIVHQASALEDSVVLDVFTPAREDYL